MVNCNLMEKSVLNFWTVGFTISPMSKKKTRVKQPGSTYSFVFFTVQIH
jgi:hypothetical protein